MCIFLEVALSPSAVRPHILSSRATRRCISKDILTSLPSGRCCMIAVGGRVPGERNTSHSSSLPFLGKGSSPTGPACWAALWQTVIQVPRLARCMANAPCGVAGFSPARASSARPSARASYPVQETRSTRLIVSRLNRRRLKARPHGTRSKSRGRRHRPGTRHPSAADQSGTDFGGVGLGR